MRKKSKGMSQPILAQVRHTRKQPSRRDKTLEREDRIPRPASTDRAQARRALLPPPQYHTPRFFHYCESLYSFREFGTNGSVIIKRLWSEVQTKVLSFR